MSWMWQTLARVPSPADLVALLNQRMKALEGELGELRRQQAGVLAVANGDTTPSVAGGSVLLTSNAAATSVTRFDDGRRGQRITLVFGDANTTLVHGPDLRLNGSANYKGAPGKIKEFVTADGTVWYDCARPTTWS